MDTKIKRIELCLEMQKNEFKFGDHKSQLAYLESFILSKFNLSAEEVDGALKELQEKIDSFLKTVIQEYKRNHYSVNKLLKKAENGGFLSMDFEIPLSLITIHESIHSSPPASVKKSNTRGRPSMEFEKKSTRGKQLASAEVRKLHEPGAIMYAAGQQPSKVGLLVKKLNNTEEESVDKALKAIAGNSEPSPKMKPAIRALAFVLNNNLTKKFYCRMKAENKESDADIWPNYNLVREAKLECRPEGIEITSLCGTVPFQNLLMHTVKRILLDDVDVCQMVKHYASQTANCLQLQFYIKLGIDGCGSFPTFMQKDETGIVPDGSTYLVSQMVPLQILDKNNKSLLFYNNRFPNSANSCRPIRISIEKETKESIISEANRLRDEISKFDEFLVLENPKVTVTFTALFTMVDGKVLNELIGNKSAASCPLCHQSSRQMSNPSGDAIPKEGSLEFGLSILHFGIHTFGALLNIAYKQDVKKSHMRFTEIEKKKIKERKQQVQEEFKQKLGLIVDKCRDGGAGSTTTGNVARVAFRNPEITAQICDVPLLLVKNLSTIWGALASGYAINGQKFGELCKSTEALYFEAIPWYPITPTLHKVLRHGQAVIENCVLPIGLTNEEASEANNKILRRFRMYHTRKTSWSDGLEDLFLRLMDVSDPIIQSFATKDKEAKEHQPLSEEIKALLQAPVLQIGGADSDSDDDE